MKPIKRSRHIVELSKDHHEGLLFCWKIKEGIKREISFERISSYIRYFWEGHLKEHFMEEEALLFNRVKDNLTARAMDEHLKLTQLINRLCNGVDGDLGDYVRLGSLLADHIRFEERELFPHLESVLTENTLICVGEHLAKKHSNPFKDVYDDEFWYAASKQNANK